MYDKKETTVSCPVDKVEQMWNNVESFVSDSLLYKYPHRYKYTNIYHIFKGIYLSDASLVEKLI